MNIRVQSKYWGEQSGWNPIQVVKCHRLSWNPEDEAYAVSGFFGFSIGYKNWKAALDDIARRHGFSYSII
jgi:hypothetical protein